MPIINTILIVIIAILFAVIYFKHIKSTKKLQNINSYDAISVNKASLYDTEIYKELYKIQSELTASKVILARFHNGGDFRNGLKMKKFSLTHETPEVSNKYPPMQDRCTAVLNSRYASSFLHLTTLKDFCIPDVNDCPDKNFSTDMRYYGFEATYLFLIEQYDGNAEGFIGINFRNTKVLTAEQRSKVLEHIPRILGLLNMSEKSLHN